MVYVLIVNKKYKISRTWKPLGETNKPKSKKMKGIRMKCDGNGWC